MRVDKDGFLVGGEPVAQDAGTKQRAQAIWLGIKGDTSAIRALLGAGGGAAVAPARRGSRAAGRAGVGAAGAGGGGGGGAASRERDELGRFVAKAAKKAAEPRRAHDRTAIAIAAKAATEAVKPGGRDAGGRFTKGEGSEESRSERETREREGLKGVKDAVADGIKDGMDFAEEIDPLVKSTKEVTDTVKAGWSILAAPLKVAAKVFGLFGGAKDKTVSWLKRIHKSLTNGPGGQGGGGMLSGLLGGVRLPGMGAVGSLLPMLSKIALPGAAIFSAFRSMGTSTDDYAKRMGVENDGGIAKELAIRLAGVLSDLGNTLTLGLAGKFGEVIAPYASAAFEGIGRSWDAVMSRLSGVLPAAGAWVAEKAGAAKGAAVSGIKQVDAATGGYARKAVNAVLGESKGLGVGRFTEAERSSIEAARAGGEKFRGGSSISEANRAIIEEAARRYGVDPKVMLGMAQLESGGNPSAVSATGAAGLFQFTAGSAKGYGITNRFDPKQNAYGAAQMIRDNAESLKKRGITPTPENLYLAHQQGAAGASQIIRAASGGRPVSDEVAKNMGLNFGATGPSDYLSLNSRKFGRAMAAANPAAPSIPTTSVAQRALPMAPPSAPLQPLNSQASKPTTIVLKQDAGKTVSDPLGALIFSGGTYNYR